jgi:flagellar basal body-associated protein FliL
MFVFLPLVLIVGAAAGIVTSGILGSAEDQPKEPKPEPPKKLIPGGYVDVPDLLVNMTASNGETRLLILNVSLQLESADLRGPVQLHLPAVSSSLNLYLRRVDPDSLARGVGIDAIKQEMEKRVADIIKPIKLLGISVTRMQIR